MTERTLLIQPRDPVIFRDGKPFTMGLPARSVDWPLPSAVIGAIRTRLGRNTRYDTATVERLKLIEHEGPFLVARGEKGDALAFPAPADAVAFSPALRSNERGETPLELCRLRPARLAAHEGTNLPGEYAPLMGALNEKPAGTPPFWSVDATLSWLADGGNDSLFRSNRELGFGRLSRQRRTHVQINAARQAAEDGALFATEGLEFSEYRRREGVAGFEDPNPRICSRIRHPEDDRWADLEALAPIGGERRLAYWSEGEIQWPAAPDSLADATLVRLQLVTPACFRDGWKPKWMESGRPPGVDGVEVKLLAAAVPRPTAHSGWDLTKRGSNGQKATRFLAPAGSVYFCEVKGDARKLWMRPISDDDQSRRDGFGLVLCGVWQWRQD